MTRQVTVWIMSLLASLQVLAGAANLVDLVGGKVAAWIVVGVAAIQAGIVRLAPEGCTEECQKPADRSATVPDVP